MAPRARKGGASAQQEPERPARQRRSKDKSVGTWPWVIGISVGLLCLYYRFSGSNAAAEKKRLQELFSKLDKETSDMLDALPIKTQGELRPMLRRDPSNVAARLGLCDHFERSMERSGYHLLIICYRRFMEAFDYFATLPSSDVRRKLPASSYAKIAGKRMITYCEGMTERLNEAIMYLERGVYDEERCRDKAQVKALPYSEGENADSCVYSVAWLLMALKMVNASEASIQRAFDYSQKVPPAPLIYKDAWNVHVQFPDIRQQAVWDTDDAGPWLRDIETRWKEVRDELFQYTAKLAEDKAAWPHKPQSEHLADTYATWNSVDLLSDTTKWNEDICGKLPIICGLVRKRPQLQIDNFEWPATLQGDVVKHKLKKPVLMVNFYQAMPGSHIRPHFGTHGRLIASLGLKIPSGVHIRIGGEHREWQEGKFLVFDDSYEHEVWHYGTEPRYVLALAILHPDVYKRPSS